MREEHTALEEVGDGKISLRSYLKRFLFASPDFHRTHATQTNQLTADLATAKEYLAKLYAHWEELEAIRVTAEDASA